MLPVIAFDKDRAYKNQITTKPPTYFIRFPKKDEAIDLHMACLESDYISAFERREYQCGRVANSLGLRVLL